MSIKIVSAEIVTIGDEILYGQITDTNTQWISAELDKIGIKTVRKSSVGDVAAHITAVFAEAEQRADVVLITGGLGPTKDDITKKVLCDYFGTTLRIHPQALADVTAFFAKRGRPLTELNRLQAALPEAAEFVQNTMGTAPGMWFERNGKVFISMPGVPYEMKGMMTNILLGKLKAFFQTPHFVHRIVRTVGIGESVLAERIEHWEDQLPEHIKLAYLPSMGMVKLRLTAVGQDAQILESQIDEEVSRLLPHIQPYVYGYGQDEIEEVVGRLLLANQQTLSTAESCTGGYVGHLITRVPGSSAYYLGGVVSYSNDLKISALGVSPQTLSTHGAVSEQAVIEMAQGLRYSIGSTYGLATSGVAGPGGGTEQKPVGMVWIAVSSPSGTFTRKLQLGGMREQNILLSSLAVLNLLRKVMLGESLDY